MCIVLYDLFLKLLQYTSYYYFVCNDVTRKDCVKDCYLRKSILSKTKIGEIILCQ